MRSVAGYRWFSHVQFFIQRYQRSFTGLPAVVWILSLVMLVNRSGAMVLPFLSIYLSSEMGWGEVFAGKAIALYGVGACVGTLISGRLTAWLGTFCVQLLSLTGTAIGFCTLSQMTTQPSVLLVLFCTSIAAESLRPANATAISEAAPAKLQRRAFALNRMAANLGFTFGPAVGGLLATYSYTLLFFTDAASCLIAAVVLMRMNSRFNRPVDDAEVPELESGTRPSTTFEFVCFMFLSLAFFLVFFQLLSTHPLFLRNQLGVTEWQIGLLMAVNTLLIVAFEMVLVETFSAISPLRMMAIGSLLICEGFAILSIGDGYRWALLATLVWTVGEMFAMPSMMAHIAQTSNATNLAGRMGWYATFVSVGFVIAPLIGTACYAMEPRLVWWIAAVMGPIVGLGYLRLDAGPGRSREHSHRTGTDAQRLESVTESRRRAVAELRVDTVDPHV